MKYRRADPGKFTVIAGPCSVESVEQIERVAEFLVGHGVTHLRGGLFRAGTYPGKNFGLVDPTLIRAFAKAARSRGFKPVIEVLDYTDRALDRVAPYADVFQVGCRQMQNYTLLRKLGRYRKPVFLKRHPGATIDEWLGAAEHLLVGGVEELALIERGSSTQATHVRWDLSISMIPAVKALTQIPVICDASHGTGRRDLVAPMARAGVAAGADGILVEVHPKPEKSLSDADQALPLLEFTSLMEQVAAIREALVGTY
jgi:3-deoxy-7-phosphoheptulonate synthase